MGAGSNALYALSGGRVGRRRRPEPPVAVTIVVGGETVRVPSDTPIGKAMGEVARLLAHW